MTHPLVGRRDDIQGLRGIAVAAVVAYHATSAFPGGWLGVDVFFVLSGYLIAQTVWRDAPFDLPRFAAARVRRLVPALTILLAAVLAAGLVLWPATLLRDLAGQIAASGVFAMNLRLWRVVDYFAPGADKIELLHLWSLGVEAQFYALFAALALGLRSVPPSARLPAVVALLVVSALLVGWQGDARPAAAFYLLPGRLWAFMAGCVVALLPRRAASSASLYPGLAALAVVTISFVFPQTPLVPVAVAPLPVVAATAWLLWEPGAASVRLLSLPMLTFLGRISYALYLWHWPLLTLPALWLGRRVEGIDAVAAVAIAVLAATASTLLVEERVRHRAGFRPLARWIGALLVVVAAALVVRATDGLPMRMSAAALAADQATRDHARVPSCTVPGAEPCPSLAGRFVLWGDSHLAHLAPAFALARPGVWVRVGADGCPPLPDLHLAVQREGRSEPEPVPLQAYNERCAQANAQALRLIEAGAPPALVVIGGAWQFWVAGINPDGGASTRVGGMMPGQGQGAIARNLQSTIARLRKRGVTVMLAGDVPSWRASPSACAARRLMLGLSTAPCRPSAGDNPVAGTDALITEVARSSKVSMFLPSTVLCPDDTCLISSGSTWLYLDSNHLSASGARILAPALRQHMPPAETAPQ